MMLMPILLMLGQAAAASPPSIAVTKATAAPAKIDAERLAAAREVVDLVLPPDRRDRMFEEAMDAMMSNMVAGIVKGMELEDSLRQFPKLRDILGRFVQRQRDLALADLKKAQPELLQAYANAYARAFEVDELRQIKAFLGTPAGQKYAQRSAQIFSDPDVAAWQRGTAERAQRREQAELDKFKAEIAAAVAEEEGKHVHS